MDSKLIAVALFTAAMALSGCGDHPQNTGAKTETKTLITPDITITQDNFSQITNRLNTPAYGGVDGINGVAAPKTGSIIPVSGDKIEVAGNYVDAIKGEAAAGVIVLIDSTPFIATYGGDRPDIAKALNNPKYLKSQFYVAVPTSVVGKGVHDLRIRVIASDKSGYYESDLIAKLDVK